jgi:hypothetical protein
VPTFSPITHLPGFDAGKFATSRAIRITITKCRIQISTPETADLAVYIASLGK